MIIYLLCYLTLGGGFPIGGEQGSTTFSPSTALTGDGDTSNSSRISKHKYELII